MRISLNVRDIADYHRFIAVKELPAYSVHGGFADFPDEYADRLGAATKKPTRSAYKPIKGLFDYQRDISKLAIERRKFAVFADCGLGKTLILLEFARHAATQIGDGSVLIVSPLMVVQQTIDEAERFYGDSLRIEAVPASRLAEWTKNPTSRIGITNYDALTDDIEQGAIRAMILDESSMLKSHYGKWGTTCIRLGRGLDWKLALTGTPAPNDRIEYANHAVFLDQFKTINAFLSTYFVNRGQTDNRWELKPHALGPFYRSLSHWCVFLTNPATYGWKDNCQSIPPIHVHIHRVPMTDHQTDAAMDMTGQLFVDQLGGIASRGKLGQLAKGNSGGESVDTNKPGFIRMLVESWPDESTIIWCIYNAEQERIAAEMPWAANITGDTPYEERQRIIAGFKSGAIRCIITKPKILGFGLNLQRCTRQVFSGLQDSYESYYQAVKRSNRVGSTVPLNVHIPITDIEAPMVDTVLRKADRVHRDTEEQERIFKDASRH